MKKYLVGIDLGNTKTDYLITTIEGEFVDILNVQSPGRNNYEILIKGIDEQLTPLLKQNDVSKSEIAALGVGLSIPYTYEGKMEIAELIGKIIGIDVIDISTDTGHGTYAYWIGRGQGIYSFASTGDITMGLSSDNKWVTIGGLKISTGEEFGGDIIQRKMLSLLYDYYYRCGKNSIVFPELISLLDLDTNDMHKSIKASYTKVRAQGTKAIMLLDDAAQVGDEVAVQLMRESGIIAGKSAAGCIRNMKFKEGMTENDTIPIVMIGSLWNKLIFDGMRKAFYSYVIEYSGRQCKFEIPEALPVVGSVLKAKEAIEGARISDAFRRQVQSEIALKSTEKELNTYYNVNTDAETLRFMVSVLKNRPITAQKLSIESRISGLMSKCHGLSDVTPAFACKYQAIISAVIENDQLKAMKYFSSLKNSHGNANANAQNDMKKLSAIFSDDAVIIPTQ